MLNRPKYGLLLSKATRVSLLNMTRSMTEVVLFRSSARQNLLPYFVHHRFSYSHSLSCAAIFIFHPVGHITSPAWTLPIILHTLLAGWSSRSRRRTLCRESREERRNCWTYGLAPGFSSTELCFPLNLPKRFRDMDILCLS